MFEVFERDSRLKKNVLANRASFEAAKDFVSSLGVVMLEDDKDYPGCADAFLNDGRVVAVQPVGFKV